MSDLERWEARFAGAEYLFGTEPNVFLKSYADLFRPGQSILAVADGEGRNGVWLAQQGFDVLSVDFSSRALTKAKALAAARGATLRFEHADLSMWKWPVAEFDAAAAIFIQFATPALRERIFAGMRGAVKPGGLVLIEGYRPEQIGYKTGGPSQIEHLYTSDMLRQAFGDWQILELREHDSIIKEGDHHVGMSALIDLVARKPDKS
jgi:SAM-dependent methyltransferase